MGYATAMPAHTRHLGITHSMGYATAMPAHTRHLGTEIDRPITYFGRTVAKVDNRTLRKLAAKAGVPDEELKFVNRYALRYYMATRSRRVQSVAVSREERAAQMGHVDLEFSTTETWYESFDPDYLEAAMRATDEVIGELNRLMPAAQADRADRCQHNAAAGGH